MLVGARQLVEQRCFPAILVARQRKGQRGILRQRVAVSLGVIASPLAQSGMLTVRTVGCICRRRNSLDGNDPDLCGVSQTQRQLIVVNPQLHGVAHRCKLDQRYVGSRNQSHIQKMLTQRSLSANCKYAGRL